MLDFLIWKARTERFGRVMEVRSLGRSVRRLREGKIVWFAVDQDMGHAASIFVPFMGIDAATLTFVPKLASRTGAPVVFMSHHRDRSAMKWAVGFERLHEFPSGDLRADAIRINQHVEKEVWKHPEQYYWVHRRFKIVTGWEQTGVLISIYQRVPFCVFVTSSPHLVEIQLL